MFQQRKLKRFLASRTLDYINPEDFDEGVQLTIVFRRRILNAILTVYLPTILVLTIVYTTNFFKEFFFEAIVSVNLTSLLVLTTLFISVSGSLPQTAYIKMVDVWLIFAQAVPWVEVSFVNLLVFEPEYFFGQPSRNSKADTEYSDSKRIIL